LHYKLLETFLTTNLINARGMKAPFLIRSVWAIILLTLTLSSRADSLFSVTTTGIKELDPNTGLQKNAFAAPITPQVAGGDGLTFSGNSLYFSRIDVSTIYALNPLNGAVLNTFNVPISNMDGLGYGTSSFGNTLFAADYVANRIFLINPLSGAIFNNYIVGFDYVGAIDFDTARGSLFATDASGNVRELNPNTGAILNTFATGTFQTGLGFVGGRLFTSAQNATTIEERDPVTGAVLHSFVAPGGYAGGLAGSPVPEPTALALSTISLAVLSLITRKTACN